MSELPKLFNTPIELDFNGVKIQAKRAGIRELAMLQDFMKQMDETNPATRDMKMLPYALFLCIKKVYPDATEDYVNDLLPVSLLLTQPNLVGEIMTKLGFILPPNLSAKEKEAKK